MANGQTDSELLGCPDRILSVWQRDVEGIVAAIRAPSGEGPEPGRPATVGHGSERCPQRTPLSNDELDHDPLAPRRLDLDQVVLPAEYSPVLALWLVRLPACRSPGYGGPEGSHACASCPASTSRKKTRAVPRGGRAAARLHRQPIPRALTTPPAGTRKRSIAVQETGHCGCAEGSVVTGARLDVRDLARIPGGHLGAGLPKVLSTVVSRRYEGTHRDAPGQAAARPSGGPLDPAYPPGAGHQHKPAHKSTPQRPRAASPAAHYNQ